MLGNDSHIEPITGPRAHIWFMQQKCYKCDQKNKNGEMQHGPPSMSTISKQAGKVTYTGNFEQQA